jgi:hypothetical protein
VTALALFAGLLGGYGAGLRLLLSLSWPAALGQGLLLVALDVPLAAAMGNATILPRRLAGLPARVRAGAEAAAMPAGCVLGWLIWSLVLWALNPVGPGRALLAGGGVFLVSGLVAGFWVAMNFLRPPRAELTRLELTLPRLPKAFDGYTIVHLSDLHVGALRSVARLRRRLEVLSGAAPDLLVVTGDLGGRRREEVAAAAGEMTRLAVREGRYAVLGNHDHRAGAGFVREELEGCGFRVLVNEAAPLSRQGERLWLVGCDDCSYRRYDDLARALRGVPPEEEKILLSHSPDLWPEAREQGIGLMLSGHTHGGQIVVPGLGPLVVPSRFGRRWAAGLFRAGRSQLYVNRGVGEVVPPVRLGCPPEVAVIVLRRAGEEE